MEQLEKYMSWINKYVESSYSLFSGQVIEGYQPLDFYHFYPLWYDLWVKRIAEVIDTLDLEHKKYSEIKELLSVPSNMRAILQKMIPSYKGLQHKNPVEYKKVANFFARMLEECCPTDPFAKVSNPLHSAEEVKKFISDLPWQTADLVSAKKLGQLITAAGSLVHGIYNDLGTDYGWDAYGPYDLGGNQSLLIRHFPDLNPTDLWNQQYLSSKKEIMIFGIYEGVHWEINYVGCHTITTKGSPVVDLKKYVVLVDGQHLQPEQTDIIIEELSQKAEAIYKVIRQKNFEELKPMVMLQESFQLKKMFDKANIDWKPTPEMEKRIAGQPLLKGVLPLGTMATSLEEYVDLFNIRYFAKEVLGEQI